MIPSRGGAPTKLLFGAIWHLLGACPDWDHFRSISLQLRGAIRRVHRSNGSWARIGSPPARSPNSTEGLHLVESRGSPRSAANVRIRRSLAVRGHPGE